VVELRLARRFVFELPREVFILLWRQSGTTSKLGRVSESREDPKERKEGLGLGLGLDSNDDTEGYNKTTKQKWGKVITRSSTEGEDNTGGGGCCSGVVVPRGAFSILWFQGEDNVARP